MQPVSDKKSETVQSKQDYSTRIFLFALELIPYFGLPAIIGFFANKRVQELYPESGIPATIAIFFTTYMFSWLIVIARYRSVTRHMKK